MNIFLDEPLRRAYAGEFNERGYTALRQVLDRNDCAIYTTYALMHRFNHYYRQVDNGICIIRYNRYGDVLGESLLVNLKPLMESATGRRLLPVCSFLRFYETGATGRRHTDRAACEISATITLGGEGQEAWPLWLENRDEPEAAPQAVPQAPGDLLIFYGSKIPHWRERFDGRYWVQMLLHYVDADGPLADHKFDRRLMLGTEIRLTPTGQLVRGGKRE